MRIVMSSLVLAALALGLAGQARAGVLSDLVGALPLPHFSISCLDPTDAVTPGNTATSAPHEKRDTLTAHGAAGDMETEHSRSDDPAMPASPVEGGADRNSRSRPTRWKALLPGALK